MFGYILPDKDELRIREYNTYRAHYCGICASIRKNFGRPLCMLISYDVILIALLATPYNEDGVFSEMRCLANPLLKVKTWQGSGEAYAADANLLYAYYKCLDDKQDSNSLRSRFLERYLRKHAAKASERLEAPAKECKTAFDKIFLLEHDNCDDIDEISMVWGEAMGSLFAHIPNVGRDSAAMKALGRDLGRWVYLIDAWDDLDKDEKHGEYNVLLKRFGSAENAKAERDHIAWILHALIDSAENISVLLKDDTRTPIRQNIIELGTRAKVNDLLFLKEK